MKKTQPLITVSMLFLFVLGRPLFAVKTTNAQQSSLFYSNDFGEGAPTLETHSPYFRPIPKPKKLELHSFVKIRVDEKSRIIAEGGMQRRKISNLSAVLSDWVRLESLTKLKPARQSEGDPTVSGSINSLYRAESDLETQESITFDITAEVVDIRPNGNLVLEAHKDITVNNESWRFSLTGLCERSAISPNNLILSSDIAELSVNKQDRGHVRDGYRRGWLLRALDLMRAF